MSDYDNIPTEAGVIAHLADRAAGVDCELVELEHDALGRPALLGLVTRNDYNVERIDVEGQYPTPARKMGTATLDDSPSFVQYVNRHSDDLSTTVWGSVARARITAVFDDHLSDTDDVVGAPGWGEHRAVLQLLLSRDWQHWLSQDGNLMTQTAFANFIEDGAVAIDAAHGGPSSAEMLQVAQHFNAHRNVKFKSSKRLDSGEVQLAYEETIDSKVGQKGDIAVPETFDLKLVPFDGGITAYRVEARFRYRLNDGELALGYRLIRPDLIVRAAFDDISAEVSNGVGLPVMNGTPRP